MLKLSRCLSRLAKQAQSPAFEVQAGRLLCERAQEATTSAGCSSQAVFGRSFFTARALQQQSGAPMMESHGDAEVEEQRREDLRQHRGTPQNMAEIHSVAETGGPDAGLETQVYQPGKPQIGQNVPAGHVRSDLSSHSCSLVLGRRRDLTLRGDVQLSRGSHQATLSQLLKGKVSVVFGVPDMGSVCSEKHVPDYLEKMGELLECGIDRVYCIAHAPTDAVASWSEKVGIEGTDKIEAWADDTGCFTRMLGLESANPTDTGSLRWAAIIQDGILLKMRVESDSTQVSASSAKEMLDCWRYFKELESVK